MTTQTQNSQQASGGDAYSIGAVARLTGISTHALRIWERRYGTVVARRTPSGRRIYSRTDVEKLSLLKLLVDHGFSIGQIAGLSLEELRERHSEVADQLNVMQERNSDLVIKVAALAGYSINRLRRVSLPDRIDLAVIESDYSRFRADVKRTQPDVILLEFPVIDADSLRRIADLRSIAGTRRYVVLFNFAHPQEVTELAAAKVELVRSPTTMESLLNLLLAGGTVAQPPKRQPFNSDADPALRLLEEDIPPRRFAEADLSAILRRQSDIACECPQHLADLIQGLAAFEVYSEQCEARDEKDAALHRYLQGTAARARSLMEEAMDTLVVEDRLLG
ncbi:MAG: MerR family transcriptional regulator [Pseudomonadota bacterium]